MINAGRFDILGVRIDAVDYEAAVSRILAAAREQRSLAVTALAVHGVMTAALDRIHRYRLNRFDLVVPDGQPVRWALRLLHSIRLPDRVYGPTLTLRTLAKAAEESLPVFFYGSKPVVLEALTENLRERFPKLRIAGVQPSAFRKITKSEKERTAKRIRDSGARMVFVGLGCPRQEVWVFEHRDLMPMPMMAVGAAFDFHAGLLPQAPPHLQRYGLEWAYRLACEPRRLWRRYLFLNPLYLTLLGLQWLRLHRISANDVNAPENEIRYG